MLKRVNGELVPMSAVERMEALQRRENSWSVMAQEDAFDRRKSRKGGSIMKIPSYQESIARLRRQAPPKCAKAGVSDIYVVREVTSRVVSGVPSAVKTIDPSVAALLVGRRTR